MPQWPKLPRLSSTLLAPSGLCLLSDGTHVAKRYSSENSNSMNKGVTFGLIPTRFQAAAAGSFCGSQLDGLAPSICSIRFDVRSRNRLNRLWAGIFQPFFFLILGSFLWTGIS